MITIVIVQSCMNDSCPPPRQFHPRQGHVPSVGQIIIVVDAAIALTVPAYDIQSGVGSWA